MRIRPGIVAALDVGTVKTCCLIARADADGGLRMLGSAHRASAGLRNGVVVDMEEASAAISETIQAAEEDARETIHRVAVNISGGRPISRMVHSEINVAGRAIGTGEIARALGDGRAHRPDANRELLHFIPLGYGVDGARGIRDPRGMYGDRLGLDLHMVTVEAGPARNLRSCIERAHVEVEAMAVSPFAAGLAALTDDEAELGVTVVDMGGGSTNIAVFHDDHVVYADSIPVGGGHVTNDIARGLTTPLAHAERLKVLHGSCLVSSDDETRFLDVPTIGDADPNNVSQVPRSLLVEIIRHRLEETFEMVRSHIADSGGAKLAGRSVVLTGGAAQLQGADRLAAMILDKKVRVGRPIGIDGLRTSMAGPEFAVAAGLLRFATGSAGIPAAAEVAPRGDYASGVIHRLGTWLRACF